MAKEKMMDDLIRRRAALDALGERPIMWTDDNLYALGERNQYDIDRLAIETVPSAVIYPDQIYTDEELQKMQDLEQAQFETMYELGKQAAEPQWIPCSDTVDIPEHEVLCCDKYGEELIGWLSYEDDQWICNSDGETMYDPIAWREKPEPWRGEEHEHND